MTGSPPHAIAAPDGQWHLLPAAGAVPVVRHPRIVVDTSRACLYAVPDTVIAALSGAYGPDSLFTFSLESGQWLPARANIGWQWIVGLYSTQTHLVPVLDPVRDRLLTLQTHPPSGGSTIDRALAWSLSAPGRWDTLALTGTPPLSRGYAGVAYDPNRDLIWMSGGTHSESRLLPTDRYDTWTLDPASGVWQQRATGGGVGCTPSVSERTFLDPWGDRLVAVGGLWESLALCPPESLTQALWELPLGGPFVWNRVTPYSATFPAGPFVFDTNRGRVLAVDAATGAVLEHGLGPDPAWSALQISGTPPGPRTEAAVAFDAHGDRLLLFGGFDANSPGGTAVLDDVWELVLDHSTPVTVSLASTQVSDSVVSVTWALAGDALGQVEVERAEGEGAWGVVATLAPDGQGRVRLTDRAVVPGRRYGYRIAWQDQGTTRRAGETWVQVPLTPVLEVGVSGTNPVQGALVVKFLLPSVAPARLQLFDAAGRRVASREVGGFGPGEHRLEISGRGGLVPGVYRLRLEQSGRARVASVVILR